MDSLVTLLIFGLISTHIKCRAYSGFGMPWNREVLQPFHPDLQFTESNGNDMYTDPVAATPGFQQTWNNDNIYLAPGQQSLLGREYNVDGGQNEFSPSLGDNYLSNRLFQSSPNYANLINAPPIPHDSGFPPPFNTGNNMNELPNEESQSGGYAPGYPLYPANNVNRFPNALYDEPQSGGHDPGYPLYPANNVNRFPNSLEKEYQSAGYAPGYPFYTGENVNRFSNALGIQSQPPWYNTGSPPNIANKVNAFPNSFQSPFHHMNGGPNVFALRPQFNHHTPYRDINTNNYGPFLPQTVSYPPYKQPVVNPYVIREQYMDPNFRPGNQLSPGYDEDSLYQDEKAPQENKKPAKNHGIQNKPNHNSKVGKKPKNDKHGGPKVPNKLHEKHTNEYQNKRNESHEGTESGASYDPCHDPLPPRQNNSLPDINDISHLIENSRQESMNMSLLLNQSVIEEINMSPTDSSLNQSKFHVTDILFDESTLDESQYGDKNTSSTERTLENSTPKDKNSSYNDSVSTELKFETAASSFNGNAFEKHKLEENNTSFQDSISESHAETKHASLKQSSSEEPKLKLKNITKALFDELFRDSDEMLSIEHKLAVTTDIYPNLLNTLPHEKLLASKAREWTKRNGSEKKMDKGSFGLYRPLADSYSTFQKSHLQFTPLYEHSMKKYSQSPA